MEVDPMDAVKDDDDDESRSEEIESLQRQHKEELTKERSKGRLNTLVAITVAILATFMGICKIKDDNIVQAMQQAQAKSVDSWNWYQAKKIRAEVAKTTQDEFEIQLLSAPPSARTPIQARIQEYAARALKQNSELADVEKQARDSEKEYDRLNYHDDQFDLSDALMALAISLLAVTSLTQKRWLYFVALVPTAVGVLFGIAGLFGLAIHSNLFAKLLGT